VLKSIPGAVVLSRSWVPPFGTMETMKQGCATHPRSMAKNFIQPGRVVTLVAPTGGVLSGQAVQVGALFGIATFDAIGGADVEVALEGVWELPKAAVAIAHGAPVFWDAMAGNVAADIGTSNALIGGATEARRTSDLTIRVRLNGDSVWGPPRRSGNGPPLAGTDKKIG
jgi:predicted RecA/RadA family phage recombinase